MFKVIFYTLGCRVNQAESAVLESVFRDKNFIIVASPEEADIAVINTCTVTQAGDSDVRKLLNRIVMKNGRIDVALIGCMAQIHKEMLFNLPRVHWVVGTADKMGLADIILKDRDDRLREVRIQPMGRNPFSMDPVSHLGGRVRANLKIQDGCDNFCAYCEIPYARGRSRSRIFSDIIIGARSMVNAGYKEIILTGIHIGEYQNERKSLIDVIDALHNISGLERIRLSSLENIVLPLALIPYMFPKGKLCRYLHIPLQSGSDRILKRMGRNYTVEDYKYVINSMSNNIEGLMIGSDIIVGFPGETDEDFEATKYLLSQLPVNYLHIFRYSPRKMARSRLYDRTVPSGIINMRRDALLTINSDKQKNFLNSQVGRTGSVLIEHKKDKYWVGHTDNYVKIKLIDERCLKNQILDVKMLSVYGKSLIGQLTS